MIHNILFHQLKGIKSWSHCLTKIDIGKVVSISSRKRLFKIIDQDYPYILNIEYIEPKTSVKIISNILSRIHIGSITVKRTVLTRCITLRYKSETEVEDEIDEVLKKYRQLKSYTDKLEKTMLN